MAHAFKLGTTAMIVLSLLPLAQAQAWTGTIDGNGGTGATPADGTVGNTLNINAGAIITAGVTAAANSWDEAGKADFKDITLNVTGGTIQGTVYGARSWLGHGDGITVSMTGGEVQGGTITGFEAVNSNDVDVSNVLVTVSGGTFTQGSELNGVSRVRNASNITLRLDGGTFTNTDRIAAVFYIHGTAENVLLEVNDGVTIKNQQTWQTSHLPLPTSPQRAPPATPSFASTAARSRAMTAMGTFPDMSWAPSSTAAMLPASPSRTLSSRSTAAAPRSRR